MNAKDMQAGEKNRKKAAFPRNKAKKNPRQPGFTLIEVLIVLVILAGLAALVVPSFFGKVEEAKLNQVKIQLKSLEQALDYYQLDNSTYPTTEQGLQALLAKPGLGREAINWRGPYIRSKELPKDPWNRDFLFRCDGATYAIGSLGADGAEGGEGQDEDKWVEGP